MAESDGGVPVTNEQKTDDDKIELNTEESKTDADKPEETQEETSKEDQYESDQFETESESEALKTDEEKVADQNKTDTSDNRETEVKTDDEKLGNDSKGEEVQREDEDDITETKGDNDETVAVDNEGNTEMLDQGDAVKESQAGEAQTVISNEGKGDDEPEISNKEEAKIEEEQVVTNQDISEIEPEGDGHDTPVETKDEENVRGETDDANQDKKDDVAVDAGPPIEKEDLQSKINENEELALKMESALSNQEAERNAYRKLTEENAKLQKHHDDMKAKLDEMEGGHVLLVAEVETLRKVSHEQKETIVKLESEIKLLKETQGGDENVKDMQEKLIRMANEQEEKDRRIHSLEGELDATREKLKDAESRAARGGSSNAQNSKTCIIM